MLSVTGVSEIHRSRGDDPVPSGGTTELSRTPGPSKEALGKGCNPGCYRKESGNAMVWVLVSPKGPSKASCQLKRGLWR